MKFHVFIAIAIVVTLGASPGARAESSQGGAFLLSGYGARVWGMGGAGVALVDDESALDWNPARLSLAPRALGASYVNLVQGTSIGQSQVVFVTPFGHAASEENTISRHAGGVMFTNLNADVLGGESYSENHLRVAYAFSPEPLVSVAIAGQVFFSNSGVSGFDAWGTGVDFAARLSLSPKWEMGIVGRDAFSRYTYSDGRDYDKERQYVIGVSTHAVRGVALSADVVRSYSMWSRAVLGAETDYLFSFLSIRAGLTFREAGESRSAAAFGASVRAFSGRLTLHYGANLDTETAFGTTHRVSLAVRL
jgi:hypothetical protein